MFPTKAKSLRTKFFYKLVENVIDLSQHVEIDLSCFRQIFLSEGNGIGIQITMTFSRIRMISYALSARAITSEFNCA